MTTSNISSQSPSSQVGQNDGTDNMSDIEKRKQQLHEKSTSNVEPKSFKADWKTANNGAVKDKINRYEELERKAREATQLSQIPVQKDDVKIQHPVDDLEEIAQSRQAQNDQSTNIDPLSDNEVGIDETEVKLEVNQNIHQWSENQRSRRASETSINDSIRAPARVRSSSVPAENEKLHTQTSVSAAVDENVNADIKFASSTALEGDIHDFNNWSLVSGAQTEAMAQRYDTLLESHVETASAYYDQDVDDVTWSDMDQSTLNEIETERQLLEQKYAAKIASTRPRSNSQP